MRKNLKDINLDAAFQPISGAAAITGLSTKYIRRGCISGEIPHIKVGPDYRINMPLFLEMLNNESRDNCKKP